jgi:hypothetical protein
MAGIPKPPTSTGTAPKTKPKSKSGGGGSSGGGGKSGGGGGGSDPYARARADQKAAEAKAAARLAAQAARLREQANALKLALGAKGFQAELKRQLGNADLEFSEKDKLVLSQYERGKGALEKQAGTTEDQRALSLQDSGRNAGRERNEALQQGIENGISATDMIKAQAASLRNWSFNVQQTQTNYTDEINGIQSEHDQMVNSVVSSRQAAWREREQQRGQLYRGYYDNRGQVLTEIGNKLGESAQYYDMANEQKSSGSYKSKGKASNAEAMKNLRAAALETGKGYKERATPGAILGFKGTAKIRNTTDARQWGQQSLEIKDAEGASSKLRKWEG